MLSIFSWSLHLLIKSIRVVHIELGDVDLQAQSAVHLECLLIVVEIRVIHQQVGLHAHTVEDTLSAERLQDRVDYAVLLAVSKFVIVVVEKLTG